MLRELVQVLAAAISGSESKQQQIVIELRRLNENIERIYPKPVAEPPPPDDVTLGDDPYTLSMAEDARNALRDELQRDPTPDEILERVRIWTDRRDPIRGRGNPSGYGG